MARREFQARFGETLAWFPNEIRELGAPHMPRVEGLQSGMATSKSESP